MNKWNNMQDYFNCISAKIHRKKWDFLITWHIELIFVEYCAVCILAMQHNALILFAKRKLYYLNMKKKSAKPNECFIKYSPLEDDFPSNLLLKYNDIMFSVRDSTEIRPSVKSKANIWFFGVKSRALRSSHYHLLTRTFHCSHLFIFFSKRIRCLFSIGHGMDGAPLHTWTH